VKSISLGLEGTIERYLCGSPGVGEFDPAFRLLQLVFATNVALHCFMGFVLKSDADGPSETIYIRSS